MKTQIAIILFICIALLSFTGVSKHKTGWEKLNLKGKVKTYKVLSYNIVVKGSDISKGDSLKSEKDYTFDATGNIIEQDDNKKYKTTSVFNNKGECVKTIQEDNYTATNKNTYTVTYIYDAKANMVEEDENMGGGRPTRRLFKYDSSGSQVLF